MWHCLKWAELITINTKGQINCISGIRAGKMTDKHWGEKSRPVDVFDVKADCITALSAMGINTDNLQVDTNAPAFITQGNRVY